MTPTNRLSGAETGLATNLDSLARVPRGHLQVYRGCWRARGDFCEVATQRKIVSLLGDLLPGNRETLMVGAGKHLLSRLDPGEGLVVLVPGIEESHDRLPERGSAFEHAVLNRPPAEQ